MQFLQINQIKNVQKVLLICKLPFEIDLCVKIVKNLYYWIKYQISNSK